MHGTFHHQPEHGAARSARALAGEEVAEFGRWAALIIVVIAGLVIGAAFGLITGLASGLIDLC